MATQLSTIAADIPVDPDAQATVTDFLDYTEYLPSDLVRSLTLIGKLDDSYLSLADKVHELSVTYGALPNTSLDKRPTSESLRHEISQTLDQAISARESSHAEAIRLYDVVDRHYNRLTSIISKLNSLPKPPSRDPTPVPQVRSPQASRTKTLLKSGTDATPPQRLMLRFDGARATGSTGRTSEPTARPRYRSRKVTVPGEVLPPPNPDSPPPITDSEWEFQPPSPVPMATSRVGATTSRNRSIKPGRVRLPKPTKVPKIKTPKVARPPRPPGAMGTNVHSAVAGISTSNALSLLSPPPADAKPGSQHAPWMRLTEWEMAKLRKRMKKNAIWSPSETMIRRELSDAGRGPENYRSCKAKADALGTEFIDEDKIATTAPGKPLAPGEISADSLGLEETQLSNRGMKLNEAKKLKREIMAREQAMLAAAEAEHAAQRLSDVGNSFKGLFTKPIEAPLLVPSVSLTQAKMREAAKDKDREKEKDRQKERERKEAREREKVRQREKEKEEEEMMKEKEKEKEKEQKRERERQKEKELEKQEKERERELQKAREIEKERKEKEIEKEKMEKLEMERERAKQMEIEEGEKLKELEKEKAEKEKEKEVVKPSTTKRKRDITPKAEAPPPPNEATTSSVKPSPKRRRMTQPHPPSISTSVSTKTTTVPLAAPGPSPPLPPSPATPLKSPTVAHRHTAPSTRSRRLSLTLRGPAPPADPPPSRAASRRGSSGPSSTLPGRELRRRSATPAPATPIITAAGRRSKRPAPGPVTSSQDGGAAVSQVRRKNAPRRKGTAAAAHARKQAEDADYAREKEEEARAEEEAAGEDIDPDEPRYCVCGDVSFGTMICCENNEVRSSTSR